VYPLIELNDVGLRFRVRSQGRISLKEYLLRGMFLRPKETSFDVHALTHVNLVVHHGERLGIIGHNGAGKSTLLKVLAGIYPPTSGRLAVNGRVSSLFDIALGFEPEANGWDNIRFRGYLQGATPATIREQMPSIAEFSELGRFLDTSVRHYSTGMLVRLAFSVATSIEPQILIVDEVLSAGDLSFQTKARERMKSLISSAQAVVVVSHDLHSLRQICTRTVWLDGGTIRMDGPADEVIAAYQKHTAGNPLARAA
jgi:ABC-type polysaccharide/polyol phosphate transport system ATPase subunit